MAAVDEWKPCEVLHQGRWLPGTVERWRLDPDGWRAFVRWSEGPGLTHSTWEPADRLRPQQSE